VAAFPGFLALVTSRGGFTKTTAYSAPDALACVGGTGGWTQCIQTHVIHLIRFSSAVGSFGGLLLHPDEMTDLVDHASHSRRVLKLDDMTDAPQTQAS